MDSTNNSNGTTDILAEHAALKAGIDDCRSTCNAVLDEVLKAVKNTSATNQQTSQDSPAAPNLSAGTTDIDSMLMYLKSLPPAMLNLDVQDICLKVTKLQNIIKSLQDRWSSVDSKIDSLNTVANNNEQYLKNYNLIFLDLCIPYDLKGIAFSQFIVEQINNSLPYLNPPLYCHDIDIAHPLNFKQKPGVIVRFVRRDIRNNIFFNKKHLLNGVTVYEHLTSQNAEILTKAQEAVGVKKAWSSKGKLFISVHGRKKQIKSKAELDRILLSVQSSTDASNPSKKDSRDSDSNKQPRKRKFNRSTYPTYRRSFQSQGAYLNNNFNNHFNNNFNNGMRYTNYFNT